MRRIRRTALLIGLFVTVILLFAVIGSSQSRRKRPNKSQAKVTNVKLPKELILQMARDDDEVKSSLQEQGGNTVKFAAKNFRAELLDLNRDGKPEWFITGSSPDFCGNRTCWSAIYREMAGKYELLLANGAVPLSTFTNGYKDLEVGFGPWIPTIYTYDGKHYKKGYDFTLDQIIMPSKWDEIKKIVCNDSKKRLVRARNIYLKDDKENSWYEKGWSDDKSYEDKWREKVKKECWQIQLEKTFKVSNDGISFYYDTTIGFPMAILASEPSSEYFYSWAVLKPFLMPSSPISTLIK